MLDEHAMNQANYYRYLSDYCMHLLREKLILNYAEEYICIYPLNEKPCLQNSYTYMLLLLGTYLITREKCWIAQNSDSDLVTFVLF